LKIDSDKKSQREWISHFVGNWLVQARFATSQGRSAESVREELIGKLKSKASGTLVDEVEGLLTEYKWENKDGVESFAKRYYEFEKKYRVGL
jgi:hypothetical protein